MMYSTPSSYYNMGCNRTLPVSWFLLMHRTSYGTIFPTLYYTFLSDPQNFFELVIQTEAYLSPPLVLCLHCREHYEQPLILYSLPPFKTIDWIHYSFPYVSYLLYARYSIPHMLLVCQSLIFLSLIFRSRLFLYWNCLHFHILSL